MALIACPECKKKISDTAGGAFGSFEEVDPLIHDLRPATGPSPPWFPRPMGARHFLGPLRPPFPPAPSTISSPDLAKYGFC